MIRRIPRLPVPSGWTVLWLGRYPRCDGAVETRKVGSLVVGVVVSSVDGSLLIALFTRIAGSDPCVNTTAGSQSAGSWLTIVLWDKNRLVEVILCDLVTGLAYVANPSDVERKRVRHDGEKDHSMGAAFSIQRPNGCRKSHPSGVAKHFETATAQSRRTRRLGYLVVGHR
eukprot:scaffold25508_cov33-Attheya_sp.AAC.1